MSAHELPTRALRIGVALVAVAAAGCTPPRQLLAPTSFQHDTKPYIYFVEQEKMTHSRIKKCDVGANNAVACETQFDLK